MLRFRLGPIPLLVHVSHLLISGLLAWQFTQTRMGTGWPSVVLSNEHHPAHTATFVMVLALWVAIITVSVIVHELGHAVVSRLFGYNAVIELVGMGGITRTLSKRPGESLSLPWHHELFIVLAGPGAGLSLGLFAGLLLLIGKTLGSLPEGVDYVLQGVFAANVFWALVNLVPVNPLDGGAISRVVLMRLFGRRGYLFAQVVTLVVALAAVALGVVVGAVVLSILFSLYAFRAVALMAAYRRGEVPVGEAAHPLHATLASAEEAAAGGQFDEAQRIATAVIAAKAPKSVVARAKAVLGWVQVKRGDGVGALRFFTEAGAAVVPPQALAAAYSLTGNEVAALPLWERAAQGGDPVVRHEWAGALIRAGRELEARRMPEIRVALAFAAAERVLYLRGEYAKAAAMADEAFQAEPSASAAYGAACAWARAGNVSEAMRCLRLASQNGFTDRQAAKTDSDLQSLRETAEFQAWLTALEPSEGFDSAPGRNGDRQPF